MSSEPEENFQCRGCGRVCPVCGKPPEQCFLGNIDAASDLLIASRVYTDYPTLVGLLQRGANRIKELEDDLQKELQAHAMREVHISTLLEEASTNHDDHEAVIADLRDELRNLKKGISCS